MLNEAHSFHLMSLSTKSCIGILTTLCSPGLQNYLLYFILAICVFGILKDTIEQMKHILNIHFSLNVYCLDFLPLIPFIPSSISQVLITDLSIKCLHPWS